MPPRAQISNVFLTYTFGGIHPGRVEPAETIALITSWIEAWNVLVSANSHFSEVKKLLADGTAGRVLLLQGTGRVLQTPFSLHNRNLVVVLCMLSVPPKQQDK